MMDEVSKEWSRTERAFGTCLDTSSRVLTLQIGSFDRLS